MASIELPEKIYKTVVKIYRGEQGRLAPTNLQDVFTVEEVGIAVQNELYAIVDDAIFTKITKKKDRYSDAFTCLNQPHVNVRVNDTLFENGVFYTLYSTSKKRPSTIRSEILKAVRKKQGWLADSLDLEFIK